MNLSDRIKLLPDSPGVYLMLDATGTVIYVGKAKSLRSRVRSYFNAAADARYQVKFLMAKVADLQVLLTDTEKEALLLENTLIKQHKPRYNLHLKDDKTYFSLRVNPLEEYPRITVVRKRPDDGARYFGPYSSATAAREVLRQLSRIFALRHYPLKVCMSRRRPCLYHQIGQCSAPCHGLIERATYMMAVEGAMMFLEGRGGELASTFKKRMEDASRLMHYEEAARWRNVLRSIELTVEKQKMILPGGDCDVLGICRGGEQLDLALLFIRGGVLFGCRHFIIEWQLDDASALSAFLQQHYAGSAPIPKEIILPMQIEDKSVLTELFSEIRGAAVSIITPRRGTKLQLVALAEKNAHAARQVRESNSEKESAAIEELARSLHLARLPRRIECYDVSTLQGSFSTGSRAVFIEGRPELQEYRRYRIRTVDGQDDYAMMAELFARRFAGEMSDRGDMPDLVVVDGGVGQLNAARSIITALGLDGRFDLVGLAKSRVAKKPGNGSVARSDERLFLPDRKNPVLLRQNSPALLLLAAIRDEAHRFAVGYHRKLRGSDATASALDAVPGIGKKRRNLLLLHFGSLQRLRGAAADEIAALPGMNHGLAKSILAALDDR